MNFNNEILFSFYFIYLKKGLKISNIFKKRLLRRRFLLFLKLLVFY